MKFLKNDINGGADNKTTHLPFSKLVFLFLVITEVHFTVSGEIMHFQGYLNLFYKIIQFSKMRRIKIRDLLNNNWVSIPVS